MPDKPKLRVYRPSWHATNSGHPISCPMTWAEFKAATEAGGVQDDDLIFAIDVGPCAIRIVVDRDEAGVEITDEECLEPPKAG
jgi:hypothetical protein